MSGARQPRSFMRCLISGTAAARAAGLLTVTRTSSEPASASSTHWAAVAAASAVSVMVIDCTTMGAPPPIWTSPTRTPVVRCSLTVLMGSGDADAETRYPQKAYHTPGPVACRLPGGSPAERPRVRTADQRASAARGRRRRIPRRVARAAATASSTSAGVWAAERNQPSNWEGGG